MYEELIAKMNPRPKFNLQWYKNEDLYSDGEVEDFIIKIIAENRPEDYSNAVYEQFNWPIYYHLSPLRKNILNWYKFKPDSSVLEIGCGMGAITNVLCDECKDVTAVELSRKRATATLLRCREKKNLEIIVGNLNDIEFEKKFDYITLIGVLEYQTEEIHPKEIQKLLQKIEGTPEEPMIARLTLRSMKQAKYSTECTGHFGLACQYYCHFTSPIRRYPDLQIHRIIKEQLRGRLKAERVEHYRDILPEVAKHSSEMERRADEAERETDKLKKVEYMEQHIGEEYEGVISGVTGWGLYVELPNTVEGLIHISSIPGDYYHYNEAACEMVGEATGRCFKLGMPVRIEVEDCDRFMRTINFRLVDK